MHDMSGTYQGQKVRVLRPAAPGDDGYDPEKTDLVLIKFEEPGDSKTIPDKVVRRDEVSPI